MIILMLLLKMMLFNNDVVDFSEYFVNYVDEVDDDVFSFHHFSY